MGAPVLSFILSVVNCNHLEQCSLWLFQSTLATANCRNLANGVKSAMECESLGLSPEHHFNFGKFSVLLYFLEQRNLFYN